MLNISISGFEEAKRDLLRNQKAVEIAAQRALLKTAQAVRDAEKAEMERVFDRPTRWTLGQIKVKATSSLGMRVGVIDPEGAYRRAQTYLTTQIEGGNRRAKAYEKALQYHGLMPQGWVSVPGDGAKLDAYGNISGGQIKQILSWFDAANTSAGSDQNMGFKGREKLRKGTKRNAGFEYVLVPPDKKGNFRQPGIYQRFFLGHGKAVKPLIIYVKQAKYTKRFDFEAVAKKVTDAMLNAEFEAAYVREIAR